MNDIATAFDPIDRLTRDLRDAAATLSRHEARFLVDAYYSMQEQRKRGANQVRALETSGEPHRVLAWYADQSERLENQVKRALDAYSAADPLGQWAREVVGIGPVIAAGLLAHIDIKKAPTAGHIWSFAGLNSDVAWLGGKDAEKAVRAFVDSEGAANADQIVAIAKGLGCCPKWLARRAVRAATGAEIPFRGMDRMNDLDYVALTIEGIDIRKKHLMLGLSKRPWNASLKVLCWKIGESFVKVSGNPEAHYGRAWAERKALEIANNAAGKYAGQAAEGAERVGKTTEAYKAYSQGRLPDGHVHARAKRYAVKLFLSHYHGQAYRLHYGQEPPLPYPIAVLGHAHLK